MEHKTLIAQTRTELGKGATGRLRKEGMIPAIIYGYKDLLNISVNAREFHSSFKTISENTIIDIALDKKSYQVLVKDFQSDIVKGSIEHLDFYEIEKGKVLKTRVPLKLNGNPPGVKEGGILVQKVEELEIECLPKDLPEVMPVDISAMNIGDSIHVRDLVVAKGLRILDNEDNTVVGISAPKTVTVDEETEEEEELVEEEV
ncbi:MAG: 50S ribosomal protein L25 [Spirochaetaceae bacterium]|jgi:large subunit ribosomal protein L25|nr:50S ribosomal protein L25 [Spirochaetaceae bacterium]